MRKFDVTGIEYDFDNLEPKEIPTLPTCLVVECEDENGVADAVSDETGWCVKSIGSITEI